MWNYILDILPVQINNKQFLVMKYYKDACLIDMALYNGAWWIMESDNHLFTAEDKTVLRQDILNIINTVDQQGNEVIGWFELPDQYTNIFDFIIKNYDEEEIKGDN